MGLMSRKASARPFSKNHEKESRWIEIRSGRGSTSSSALNENRSRDVGRSVGVEREGKGLLLIGVRFESQALSPGSDVLRTNGEKTSPSARGSCQDGQQETVRRVKAKTSLRWHKAGGHGN